MSEKGDKVYWRYMTPEMLADLTIALAKFKHIKVIFTASYKETLYLTALLFNYHLFNNENKTKTPW